MNRIPFRLYVNFGWSIRYCEIEEKSVKAILFYIKRDIGSCKEFDEYK